VLEQSARPGAVLASKEVMDILHSHGWPGVSSQKSSRILFAEENANTNEVRQIVDKNYLDDHHEKTSDTMKEGKSQVQPFSITENRQSSAAGKPDGRTISESSEPDTEEFVVRKAEVPEISWTG
jgi:hypothetical protein